jgi:hypothetical protein
MDNSIGSGGGAMQQQQLATSPPHAQAQQLQMQQQQLQLLRQQQMQLHQLQTHMPAPRVSGRKRNVAARSPRTAQAAAGMYGRPGDNDKTDDEDDEDDDDDGGRGDGDDDAPSASKARRGGGGGAKPVSGRKERHNQIDRSRRRKVKEMFEELGRYRILVLSSLIFSFPVLVVFSFLFMHVHALTPFLSLNTHQAKSLPTTIC